MIQKIIENITTTGPSIVTAETDQSTDSSDSFGKISSSFNNIVIELAVMLVPKRLNI